MAVKLDGKSLSQSTEQELTERVLTIKNQKGFVPILATILVGSDPASGTYVKMKGNACERIGMKSLKVELDENATTDELLLKIDELNSNPEVHGILLQHPVPGQINERLCFDAIDTRKDVDGVTSLGFGKMAMGEPAFGSCTPQGIMRLLEEYDIEISGKHAVVVGRSPILGKPMAMMLLNKHATVTICHSRTKNLKEHVLKADIVVGAVGN
jgi:methylenetetrahydrofolate dehydrogenase (NADP+)/methenyltetrahydrofolate cyclohydrolase